MLRSFHHIRFAFVTKLPVRILLKKYRMIFLPILTKNRPDTKNGKKTACDRKEKMVTGDSVLFESSVLPQEEKLKNKFYYI